MQSYQLNRTPLVARNRNLTLISIRRMLINWLTESKEGLNNHYMGFKSTRASELQMQMLSDFLSFRTSSLLLSVGHCDLRLLLKMARNMIPTVFLGFMV